jgi:hypothetical protein
MAPRLRVSNVWLNAAETAGISHYSDNVVRISGNAMSVPVGTNANRPTAANGMIRYNVDQVELERVKDSVWATIATNVTVGVAHSQANAAYTQGNVALAHANIVFAQANTAYNRANSANADAVAAFIIANTVFTQANLKANIAGQAFTGGPSSPTAANGTSNTMIATTQFVQNEFGLRLGKHTIWVPAAAFAPFNTSAGPSTGGQIEVGGAVIPYVGYDPTSAEYGYSVIAMPKSWDLGTVTAIVYWAHPATTTNFGVVWVVGVASFGDNEAISNIYTTANITDTGGTTSNLYITSESSAINPGGTEAARDLLPIFIGRLPTDGSDTMAVDAYLIGVQILYTINAWSDT